MVGVANIGLPRQPAFQFRRRCRRAQRHPVGEQFHRHAMPRIADQLVEHRQRRPRPKGHSFKGFGTSGGDPTC